MSPVAAGKFDRRVTIQTVTETNTAGSLAQSFSTFADVWAKLVDMRGDETFLANREHAKVEYRLEMRYLAGVVPKMRILDGTRTFDVQAVLSDRRRPDMTLMLKELV